MSLTATDIDYLKDLVVRQSGNVLNERQGYLVESRLAPVAHSLGMTDVPALVAQLRKTPNSPLHQQVAEAMTINETSFFRDLQPFESLQTTLIPALLEKRAKQKKLSIWCAACSSGQEPYSVAMVLREHFGTQLESWSVNILATDVCDAMIQRTREATYSQFEVNRGLPARFLVKYFTRQGLVWQIKDEVRKLVQCRKFNLIAPWPFLPTFDIVFLRNVLIYFDTPAKEGILRQLHRVCQSDAYLLLGGGETLLNLNVPFQREVSGKAVYFRPTSA